MAEADVAFDTEDCFDVSFKVAEFPFGPVLYQFAVCDVDKAGRVVPPVFKALEAFEENGYNLPGADVANYAAHIVFVRYGLKNGRGPRQTAAATPCETPFWPGPADAKFASRDNSIIFLYKTARQSAEPPVFSFLPPKKSVCLYHFMKKNASPN
jgi:hypothetical protein